MRYYQQRSAGTLVAPHLSLRRCVHEEVVVVSPLVPFLRRPHSRIRLSGALRHTLVVFCLITLWENEGLLFWTWQVNGKRHQQGSGSFWRDLCRRCSTMWRSNGCTPAVTFDSWVGGWGARAGPRRVCVFLQALHPHPISAVFVTVYPAVWETQKKTLRFKSERCLIKGLVTQIAKKTIYGFNDWIKKTLITSTTLRDTSFKPGPRWSSLEEWFVICSDGAHYWRHMLLPLQW